jgi:hypothetical protein
VYAWEFSLAFLVLAVLFMVVATTILIWAGARYGPWKPEGTNWWEGNAKVSRLHCLLSYGGNTNKFNLQMAVLFTSVLGLAVVFLILSQGALSKSNFFRT